MIIALTSSILGFGSLEELTSCTPLDWVVYEREISPFLAPAVGWLTLRLNSVVCHIFGRSQSVGYLSSC